MPNNLCPAKRGRFQTRLSRLVDILSSKTIQEPVPGAPGKTVEKVIWLGTLYASNGKTPEGNYEWEASGAYRNQRGVASPLDLAVYVGQFPGQIDQVSGMVTKAEAEAVLNSGPSPEPPKSYFEVDPRLQAHVTGLILDCYDYLLKAAAELGLDVEGRAACIRGPWVEAINDTLVGVMDSPKSSDVVSTDAS